MSSYTPAQLAVIAQRGGFSGDGLVKAVAVALAESGGNPQAVGTNLDKWRSRDRGLWQINSHWHPEVSDAAAFNPDTAAKAAYTISKGGRDWSAWSTSRNGAALAQTARARIGVAQAAKAGGGVQTVADPGDLDQYAGPPKTYDPLDGSPLGSVPGIDGLADAGQAAVTSAKVLVKAGAWAADPHNWVRVQWVGLGSVAVLVALYMIGRSGAAGDTAASATRNAGKAASLAVPITKAAKAGKVARAAKAVA